MSGDVLGAKRVDVSKRFADGLQEYNHMRARRNPGHSEQKPKVEEILGLSGGESLKDGVSITTGKTS